MTKCRAKDPSSCRFHSSSVVDGFVERAHILARVSELVPKETAEQVGYYLATTNKHFGDKALPGSKFLDRNLNTIENALLLASEQRNGLDGDDRLTFIKLGASEDAFQAGVRYLYLNTLGTVGIKNSASLGDDVLIHVMRTKPGTPATLVVDVEEQQLTEHGVIILGTESDGREVLWTLHPGLPVSPTVNEVFEGLVGESITVSRMRSLVGDVWLNTRILK